MMWSVIDGRVLLVALALAGLVGWAVLTRQRSTCRTRGLKCLLPRRVQRTAGAQATCTECGRVWTYQRVAFRDGQLKAVWTSPRKS